MSRSYESQIARATHQYASHIPIPYGCMSLIALILGALATAVFSSLAIGIAILK
jgi:hypothetical protein